MKKFLMVVFILLIILGVLISCAPDPSLLFDNFVNDLEIEGRFADYAAEIQREKSSDVILRGIDVLIEDLNTMTLDNATAKDITASFIAACKTLREAAQLNIDKHNRRSQARLKDARDQFQQALRKSYAFTMKQE